MRGFYEGHNSLLESLYSICYSSISDDNTGKDKSMNNYIYLVIVLVACLLGATAILYEQVSGLDKQLQEQFEKLDREMNS